MATDRRNSHEGDDSAFHTDLDPREDYAGYLRLDRLLSAQRPLSDPPHHDEMLFVIQHQVAELWFKLTIHELEAAMAAIRADDLARAAKILARVKQVQHQLYSQWDVLDTLTPSEYAEFRHVFGQASGFQSPQYRLVEFMLGNKDPAKIAVFARHEEWHRRLSAALEAPAIFDEFLRHLARIGLPVPRDAIERDFTSPRDPDDRVVAALGEIYAEPERYWQAYELAEALMDVSNNFQFWRYHHLKTVERIIGHKRGSGGTAGVTWLKRALDYDFFPELIRVRTELGDRTQ
jgi:tryptophan 2,3-dioxygenase